MDAKHIETAVGLQCLAANALGFGKGGRIKHHYIELLTVLLRPFKVVKYIGCKKLMSVSIQAVEGKVLTGSFNGGCRDVYTGDSGLVASESRINGEAACIAETIQDALAMCILA